MAKEIGDGTTTATILAHAMVRGGVKAVAAELLEDTPGALWSHGSIEASRLRSAPQMTRVVVAIDPAVTSGDEADETGIIVAGKATTATAMCWPTSRGVIRRPSGPAWRSPPTRPTGPR